MARHVFLPPLSVHRHRPHPLGVCGFESFQTLHPRKRAARPDSRPLYELCRHTCLQDFPKIRHPLCRHGTQQHHYARFGAPAPMAAYEKCGGTRRRTSRRQPPFRTRPATQIRLRMAVPPPTYWAEYSTDRLNKEKKNNKPHFVFCTVSHLRRLKGHDVLLTAFARALAQCPQLRLNIGGSGQEEQRLKQQAAADRKNSG